jgi:hypothetical protein
MTGATRAISASGISTRSAPAIDLPARFLGFALVNLLFVALTAPFALPLLLSGYYQSKLLVFVHLNTIGVVGMMIVGASYQLVPVVLQTPIASERLGRASFWCLVAGILAFLSGLYSGYLPLLGSGGTLMVLGFAIYIVVLVLTLLRAPVIDIVGWHIAASLFGLAGGMTLGLLLALNRGAGFLGGMTLRLLATHIVLMVGGWVMMLLMGVAYRLIGMFTVSEERVHPGLARLCLTLLVGGVWLLAASALFGLPRPFLVTGGVLLLTAHLAFAAQLVRIYRGRRRRGIDVHMPFMVLAAALGLLAVALVIVGIVTDSPALSRIWVAAAWFGIAGMAETAIMGMFYKIATFLIWLRSYAPLAGRYKVPRLEELYRRRLALTGFAVWLAALIVSAGALIANSRTLAIVAGLTIAVGLGCFLINVAGIARHWRAPELQPRVSPNAR